MIVANEDMSRGEEARGHNCEQRGSYIATETHEVEVIRNCWEGPSTQFDPRCSPGAWFASRDYSAKTLGTVLSGHEVRYPTR